MKKSYILTFFLITFLIGVNINPIVLNEHSNNIKTSSNRPKIVTYMSITEDWTRELLRNVEADIHVLVQGNEDVHSYDPSSESLLKMDGADLFVKLNIPIETYADQISNQFPNVPVVNLWVNITEDPLWGYQPRKDPVWQHPANPPNMHMWTSPSIARNFIHRLAEGLKSTIGTEIINNTIDANLQVYDLQLNNTITWLSTISKKEDYRELNLIPFHPAFFYYLEDDLNLTRIAVIEEKPGVEISAQHLDYIRSILNNTCTILWHPQESISKRYANDLSIETGAKITMLTPIIPIRTPSEWVPKFGSQIDSFLEMVEFNTYQLSNASPYQYNQYDEVIGGYEIFIIFILIFGLSSIVFILKRRKIYERNNSILKK